MRRSGVRLPSAPPVPPNLSTLALRMARSAIPVIDECPINLQECAGLTQSMTPDTQLAATETTTQRSKSAPRYLPHIARVLMGLMFFIFGLNGFFNFIPPPKAPMPEGA